MSVYLVVFAVLSSLILIKCLFYWNRRVSEKWIKDVMNADTRTLIVTAHPDDECMFFAPSIIRQIELKAEVHLLCLSEGNFYNQGPLRKQELLDSCAVLGIPDSRVTVKDHKKLPDDPKAEWSVSLVSSLILDHIRDHAFNMVLTFDGRGVSGHANHIAIHKAVSHLASTGRIPDGCCLLSLQTVGLFRKYASFLELPVSWLLPSTLCCVIGCQGYRQAREAMFCHRSQLLWFRRLYVFFSRYMFINTFQKIPQGRKNLKIY